MNTVKAETIEKAVEKTFNTPLKLMLKPSRERHICERRHILFMLQSELSGMSEASINKRYKFFSNHHGMNSFVRKTRARIQRDPKMLAEYNNAITNLNAILAKQQ